MDFVLLFVDRKPAPAGEPAGSDALAKLAAELARDGKLHRAAPLAPEAEAARERVRGGRATVTDGPFAESKEEVVGLWIFEAATREEALEVARRAYEIG